MKDANCRCITITKFFNTNTVRAKNKPVLHWFHIENIASVDQSVPSRFFVSLHFQTRENVVDPIHKVFSFKTKASD